jgi:hypothetical protein
MLVSPVMIRARRRRRRRRRRGFAVSEEDAAMGPAAFRALAGDPAHRDSLALVVSRAADETDQLMVFFPEDESVGVKTIKAYVHARAGGRARRLGAAP